MPFSAIDAHLPSLSSLPDADGAAPALPSAPLGSFGDDLMLPSGGRLSVRATARGTAERLTVDFRDSDPAEASEGFGLGTDDARLASVLALCHALGVPADRRWLERLDVHTDPHSWIGGGRPNDPGRRAMSLARAFDAVLGALASSWPTRVGAGSCTVGALVELHAEGETICEAIAGGEGATPARRGHAAWHSPILGTITTAGFVSWLSIAQRGRGGSGGGGARVGGDGVERIYEVDRAVVACVGIDRVRNPPHGIDRAGPPQPATAAILTADGSWHAAPSWTPFELTPRSKLKIETAGGAGHGFGGYGDIEFDPSEWFGSKDSH